MILAAGVSFRVVHAHARLPLAQVEVVAHIMTAVYAWRLIVVGFCETVHVTGGLGVEALELSSSMLTILSGKMPLLARIARRPLIGTFPVHIQICRIHCVALHV